MGHTPRMFWMDADSPPRRDAAAPPRLSSTVASSKYFCPCLLKTGLWALGLLILVASKYAHRAMSMGDFYCEWLARNCLKKLLLLHKLLLNFSLLLLIGL